MKATQRFVQIFRKDAHHIALQCNPHPFFIYNNNSRIPADGRLSCWRSLGREGTKASNSHRCLLILFWKSCALSKYQLTQHCRGAPRLNNPPLMSSGTQRCLKRKSTFVSFSWSSHYSMGVCVSECVYICDCYL